MNKKVALITGGNRGIGAATAKLLAHRGYLIAISYRQRKQQAEELIAELRSFGVLAIAVRADISSEKDIVQLFNAIDEQLGPISCLVNEEACGLSSINPGKRE
ncbi:hypothetical protein BTJ40_01130 [Microbulbifer sp. A4B17]|uniref:SDR family NAD(P)-dependent oxidoreductase n=1 Tax=Microbulbifer sp. A4B17 TaxID=359370 RepID=UPI000D52B736|nr:SDR family NAD(P)-dependent oxidoreductase [Microbulbifer sp. A4B17]AWF79540.1 hypothetical protein BTJ40_01130 [Microbulbifer sp. A4B17]